MDAEKLLEKYFNEPAALEMVAVHGRVVAELAFAVGHHLGLESNELVFLREAAILHDIGICRVYAPGIGLYGEAPYITHGIHGCEILLAEGLPRHAMACERHIGVGLTRFDIETQKLPLPMRDMVPCTLAEEIICFADLFYSKNPERLTHRKTPERVRRNLEKFGNGKVQIFDKWLARFGGAMD